MTVAEVESRVSSRELTEWMAYDALEPIGGFRTDYGFAMLAALYVNAHRKPGSAAAKVSEFMPWLPKSPAAESKGPEAWIAMLKALGGSKSG
jgi:hypothetical protein